LNMKFLIVFVALFALAVAGPVNPDADATIVRQDADVGPQSFQFAYETSNGIRSEADGHLENEGTDAEAIKVKGSFSFTADDGQTYTVNYVADENGFQPEGAHLPVAPVA
ncbi:hypothetical protein KR044_012390, partial [Drosophila immigrans]